MMDWGCENRSDFRPWFWFPLGLWQRMSCDEDGHQHRHTLAEDAHQAFFGSRGPFTRRCTRRYATVVISSCVSGSVGDLPTRGAWSRRRRAAGGTTGPWRRMHRLLPRRRARNEWRQPTPATDRLALGVGHSAPLPLPALALEQLEPVFDPGPHRIPQDIALVRFQVGQNEPGFLVSNLPAGEERAIKPSAQSSRESQTASFPPSARFWNKLGPIKKSAPILNTNAAPAVTI